MPPWPVNVMSSRPVCKSDTFTMLDGFDVTVTRRRPSGLMAKGVARRRRAGGRLPKLSPVAASQKRRNASRPSALLTWPSGRKRGGHNRLILRHGEGTQFPARASRFTDGHRLGGI